MSVPRRRKLDLTAGVAHALEAAIVGRVCSPARHSRDIELPVAGIEPSAVHTRSELARQLDDGPLGLAVDFLTKNQEVRTSPVAEMQEVPFERTESAARHSHLATARVVKAARKVDKWNVGSLARLGTLITIVTAGPDFTDH